MQEILLNGERGCGLVAVVDDEDCERLNRYKWYLTINGYAATNLPGGRTGRRAMTMHRMIIGGHGLTDTDHANGNKLDNRRSNLRPATRTQNNANHPRHRHSAQPFKGVRRRNNRWAARIRVENREISLGRFNTAEEAAAAYNRAARKYFGEFARLNEIGGETCQQGL